MSTLNLFFVGGGGGGFYSNGEDSVGSSGGGKGGKGFLNGGEGGALAFITNRQAISVKFLHDVHSFLAPNTPRGSLPEGRS